MAFIERYTYTPTTEQLTAIEGVKIIDLAPTGAPRSVGQGVVALLGEAADSSYGVTIVVATGAVTVNPHPVEIFGDADLLSKIGGFDSTIGEFGGSFGNLYAMLKGRTFARLIVVPVSLASGYGVRLWRDLPTNKSAIDARPIVSIVPAEVPAGFEFKTGSNRVRTASRVVFDANDPIASGIDAAVTAVTASATAGTETGAAGPFLIRPTQVFRVSINQGAVQEWTFDGTRGSKTGAAAAYAGVVGTLVLRLNEDASTDQTITFDGSENSEAKALARINGAWSGGAAVDDAGQIKLQSDRYGTSSNARIVSGTAGLLTDLGLASGLGSAGTATCTKTGGTGAKTVTIAFLDAATASEIAAAIVTADGLTGGTLAAASGALVLTTSTAGATPNGVQVKNTSTAGLNLAGTTSLGLPFTEVNGTAAGPGTQATNPISSATSTFETDGVQAGDVVVLGVIGGAGALGANALMLRVVSVDSETQLTVEKMDGLAFSFTTTGALPFRVHPGRDADSALATLATNARFTVLARPLDATIPISTTCTPTYPAATPSATAWEPRSGLRLRTRSDQAVVYTAAVQAPNAAASSALEALYEQALATLRTEELPAREVNLVGCARCSQEIDRLGQQHVVEASRTGLGQMVVSAPPLDVLTVDSAIDDVHAGYVRDERRVYTWPGARVLVREAVGTAIACADGTTTTDGLLDMPFVSSHLSVMSVLPSHHNPGQSQAPVPELLAHVRGVQRGVASLTMQAYKAMKRRGVSGLRMDRTTGPVIQSGVTSSLDAGRTEINRRRMADMLEDSLAAVLAPYQKLPVTETMKAGALGDSHAYLAALKSVDAPERAEIRDFSCTDTDTTANDEQNNVYRIKVVVELIPLSNTIVLSATVGLGTELQVTAQ